MVTLKAQLQHLAIVSWAVPIERLAPMLPRALEPTPIDADEKWGIFSMATMLDATLGKTYSQVNERAYVRKKRGGDQGAYFWKSHADTDQADMFRWLLGIPEFHDDVHVESDDHRYVVTFDGQTVLDLDLDFVPPLGKELPDRPAGTTINMQLAWDLSKNPMIGYTLDWGALFETPVQHNAIVGGRVGVRSVDPTFMVPAVTLDPGQAATPIFAAYQKETPFYITLPPRPVGGLCGLASRIFFPLKP